MPSRSHRATGTLFESASEETRSEPLATGATILRKFALHDETAILAAIREVDARAPFRQMVTPGGYRMSVAMTNCGPLGWVTDRSGYRYSPTDPMNGQPWPSMPAAFLALAL